MDDATRDRLHGKPKVVPIGGYQFPPPPDWSTPEELGHTHRLRQNVVDQLGPENLTIHGRPRCTQNSRQTGERCGNAAVPGTHVCRFHGASGKILDDDDLTRPNGNQATRARAERIELIRQHLELTAQAAVLAVQAILEDEDSRPADRLKAAEIVLDRTVGRHLQLEKEDLEERDLDEEILALTDAIATGTDGAAPTS